MNVADPHHKNPHDVTVIVNSDPVVLPSGTYTALAIKEAAIAQHVPDITLDFVLSVHEKGAYTVLADTDTVRIHENLDFLAVVGDENS